MKKLIFAILSLGTLFTSNASADNVSVKTSWCNVLGYSWNANQNPSADKCHDIRAIYSYGNGLDGTTGIGWEDTYGSTTTTYYDHGGSTLYIIVDVFGLPANEPTVIYKYKTLPLAWTDTFVNYDSSPAIINGTRYWFVYQQDSNWGAVDSGDVIVKSGTTIKDTLRVK